MFYSSDTINSLPPDIVYKSATATVKELAPELRNQGADVVIAITHAREPNDNKLAENLSPGTVDMILGGRMFKPPHTDSFSERSVLTNLKR